MLQQITEMQFFFSGGLYPRHDKVLISDLYIPVAYISYSGMSLNCGDGEDFLPLSVLLLTGTILHLLICFLRGQV